jgi:F-type H+-transporting ATPase subunit delta
MILPSKYAEALYKAAEDSNTLGAVTEELRMIKNIIDSSVDLKKVLLHPGISKADKQETVKALFGEKVTKLTLRMIMLLIEKKREAIFDDICMFFFQKIDDKSGLKKITIETAFPLEEAEKANLIAKLEKAMDKKLVVDAKVNPSILGGIIIKERMKQIDISVIQFLKSMKTDLVNMKMKAPKTAVKKSTVKAAPKKAVVKTKTIKKPAIKKTEVKKTAVKKKKSR